MDRMLKWAILVLLIGIPVFSDEIDKTCELDGTCDGATSFADTVDSGNGCLDDIDECQEWVTQGLCEKDQHFMYRHCRKSCDACNKEIPNQEDEYGIVQIMDRDRQVEMQQAIDEMKEYFRKAREDPNTTPKMHEILDNCKLRHDSCAFWMVIGECEKNPDYMKTNCAPICQTCEHLSIEYRCPIDNDAPVAWKPGDVNAFFVNITTLPQFQAYDPNVLSRPDYINGDTEGVANYKIGPWVVLLDNFITDEEADHLIQLGDKEGYERSADVGKLNFDGTFENNVNNGRTSLNAWCQNSCYDDPIAKQVMERIQNITFIPEPNSEYLQLLRYEVGQFYKRHHDYIHFQVDRQTGVRILTVFLYLNDVEAGGGTNFPFLDITVMPKKGRALLWPSVLDSDPNAKDYRTEHQALPVEKGIKYGANAWLHQRDFKTPNRNGCQ